MATTNSEQCADRPKRQASNRSIWFPGSAVGEHLGSNFVRWANSNCLGIEKLFRISRGIRQRRGQQESCQHPVGGGLRKNAPLAKGHRQTVLVEMGERLESRARTSLPVFSPANRRRRTAGNWSRSPCMRSSLGSAHVLNHAPMSFGTWGLVDQGVWSIS